MKIIGLCGGSGSGKGTVSSLFLEKGIPSVDTDAIYRNMTNYDSPCLRELSLRFGKDILSQDGSLDRKRLSAIVFTGVGATERLNELNRISHKHILAETREILSNYREDGKLAALVDAPVLFESGFDKECDLIICVISDRETRIERIMARDMISCEAAEQRLNSQMDDEELITRSDFVIYNNGGIDLLEEQIASIVNQLK